MFKRLNKLFSDLRTLRGLPSVTIHLAGAETAGNDPFYARLAADFYRYVSRRHPRLLVVGAFEFGVALCELPRSPGGYEALIEASGRRNVKKALRLGYEFKRIDFNAFLADIRDIRRSTDSRQGEVTGYMKNDTVEACRNPPSKSNVHDYVYYGIVKEGRLVAYAGCLVSGDLCMIEHILGHANFLGDGVVPMLIAGMAGDMVAHYPRVKYYAYGTYFGGGETMRRFKAKFAFQPHRVIWER